MKKKHILLLLAMPLILILLVRLFINVVNFASVTFFPDPEWDSWKNLTSPLTKEQMEILCDNFDLNEKSICNRTGVYGPEFYDYIINAFYPIEEFSLYGFGPKPATYTEVENKIGYFKNGCGATLTGSIVPGKEFQYFKCSYDLRGDGANILTVFFRLPEKEVLRITRPVGKDDW
jgi:hypothetical protein